MSPISIPGKVTLKQQTHPTIVTDSLVLHLDAGNTSSYPGTGTTWTDLSGNGNNGTLVNGVGYNSANGGSLTFDGTNDYVTIPNNQLFNISSDNFCFESWIYLTNYSSSFNGVFTGAIISRDNQTRSFTFSVSGNSSSWTSLGLNLFSGNTLFAGIGATFNFSLNTWYHLSVSRIGTNIRFYVNGVDVGGGSNSTIVQNSTYPIEIGSQSQYWAGAGYGYYFPGYISNLRIYKGKGLTPQEVQQNYNALKWRYGL